MPRMRGKRFTLVALGLLIVLVVVGPLLLKDALAETWYIRQLQSGNRDKQRVAAQRLALMGSTDALPYLFEILAETTRNVGAKVVFTDHPETGRKAVSFEFRFRGGNNEISRNMDLWEAADTAALRISWEGGEEAEKQLIRGLHSDDAIVRSVAICLLTVPFVLDDQYEFSKSAAAALREATTDSDSVVRAAASAAIARDIGSPRVHRDAEIFSPIRTGRPLVPAQSGR